MSIVQARQPTETEREALEKSLRSDDAFAMRRSQMILMSADEGLKAADIGQRVGRSDQNVRQVLHAFNAEGIACLKSKSSGRPDDQRAFDDAARQRLCEIIAQSPRTYGYSTGLWSLQRIAEVSYREGLTDHEVHFDTVSETFKQMGINWQRARHRINSPDPHYAVKKSDATG